MPIKLIPLFLLVLTTASGDLSLAKDKQEPTTSQMPVIVKRLNNKLESFIGHPFLKKCISINDLPAVTTPIITYNQNSDLDSVAYTIRFNGENLKPNLLIESEKVALEKTTDKYGYIITVTRNINEIRFSLQFELYNQNGELILHELKINKNQAIFTELLTEEQLQRLCIRDQIWVGLGFSNLLFKQYTNELDADLDFSSAFKIPALNIEYKKYLNANWGLVSSYKKIATGIKNDSQISINQTEINWQILEVGVQWRKVNWTINTKNSLIYPYLKMTYQSQDMPLIHLSAAGDAKIESANLQEACLGAGLNIFMKNGYLYDFFLNYKMPIYKSSKFVKIKSSVDGAFGISKVITESLTVGVNLYNTIEQFDFESTNEDYKNRGQLNLNLSVVDLKIGWVY